MGFLDSGSGREKKRRMNRLDLQAVTIKSDGLATQGVTHDDFEYHAYNACSNSNEQPQFTSFYVAWQSQNFGVGFNEYLGKCGGKDSNATSKSVPEVSSPYVNVVNPDKRMNSKGLNHKPIVPSDVNRPSKPRGRPKGAKNRFRSVKVKVPSPRSTSAGAGAILKRLRCSKIDGKGKSRSVASSMEDKYGKRFKAINTPVDDALSKVLDRINYDNSIPADMVFKEGVSDKVKGYCMKPSKGYCSINGNDGSFINKPLKPISSDVNDSIEYKEGGVDDVVDPCLASNDTGKSKVADGEHFGSEGVRKTNGDVLNGGKDDSAFVFGKTQNSKGILKKPPIGLTSVQFGPSLFYKVGNAWSSYNAGVKALKSDGSINTGSFAEKMKKGVEDRELQMNFAPQCVSKSRDGARRVAILVEDIKKGSEACALQLYGYFFDTSMDYRVVNVNLSKMWRAYGVSDITKTNADLPNYIEIEYPQFGNRPARVGKPRTEEEIAAKVISNALKVNVNVSPNVNVGKADDDGFTTVGRNNKPIINQSSVKQNDMKYRNSGSSNKQVFYKQGPNQQFRVGNSKSQAMGDKRNGKVSNNNNSNKGGPGNMINSNKSAIAVVSRNSGLVQKPALSTKYNDNFKPRVLVRGSGSNANLKSASVEHIPIANSYQAFEDHDMIDKEEAFNDVAKKEYDITVWPMLK
ncbi:hypothetical protein CTI12_AA001390 [Artemisia annua]|uniref:Uncharacterized protein n=1 Tax=Artemisia annua TaxID=35608 RepID=A0A2U1QKW2_ARTAN|nr:hypothetical protein CTI12_AA001390 [Artemisia annua]